MHWFVISKDPRHTADMSADVRAFHHQSADTADTCGHCRHPADTCGHPADTANTQRTHDGHGRQNQRTKPADTCATCGHLADTVCRMSGVMSVGLSAVSFMICGQRQTCQQHTMVVPRVLISMKKKV